MCEGRRRARTGAAAERGVPGWLASIIDRGLAVDPAARWPSVKELLEWSPDGEKLLVVRSDSHFVELEVATGKTLRTIESGAAMIAGVTYVGEEVIVGRPLSGQLGRHEMLRERLW